MPSSFACRLALLFLMSIPLTGCAPPAATGRPHVVTTVGMLGDLVRQVAGDDVDWTGLMGPGVDPHLYKPKESAIRKMFAADRICYLGLHLEGKMDRVLSKSHQARAAGRGLPPELLLDDDGEHDPHVWFDVSLWAMVLDQVADDLVELLPHRESVLRERADRYRQELLALHAEVKRDLAAIPKERRVMVTAHDAFRYFGRAYDLEVVGLQGVSTANQAGLRKVQEVVDLVVSRRGKALFLESSLPPDGVEAVLARCHSRSHPVNIASEELYSDALGPPDSPAGSYVGMVRHNVRVIVDALR